MTRSTTDLTPIQIGGALLAIAVLSGFLRFSGIGYLLPLITEPDSHIVVQVQTIETGLPAPETSADWPKYPHFVAQLTAALTDPAPLPPASAPLADHLEAAAGPILRVRKTVAWLSLLLIPVTFLLARRFVPNRWALMAALLAGTSLLSIHFGTQARPHGAAVAFPALTVIACLHMARGPTYRNYLLVALAGFLAMGNLQSAVALGFPVVVAHFLSGRGLRHHMRLLVPLTGVFAAILIFYPFLLGSVRLTHANDTLELGGHEMFLNGFRGGGFPIVLRTLWGWEPALSIGALLAAGLAITGRLRAKKPTTTSKDFWIICAYVIPYALVICLNPRTGERFVLPLIPFISLWSVWGLHRLSSTDRKVLGYGLAASICTLSILVGVKLTILRHRPTTLDQAAGWLADNADVSDSTVHIFRPNTLPIFKTEASTRHDEDDVPLKNRRQLNWSSYQRDQLAGHEHEDAWDLRFCPINGAKDLLMVMRTTPRAYLRRLGNDDILILEIYEHHRVLQGFNNLTEAARVLFPKIAEFKAGPPHEVPLRYQDISHPTPPPFALRILQADRLGPPLEIFRLQHRQ